MNLIINNQPINTPYGGKELPSQGKKYTPPVLDLTNNPSAFQVANAANLITQVGPVTLPLDVMIIISGGKVIAESMILDGPEVFEHLAREPYKIELQFTVRVRDASGNPVYGSPVFPQKDLQTIFNQFWLPDSLQQVKNTLLNGLGISQIIVKDIHIETVRGSTNVPVRMAALENVPGQSLIIG